MRSFWGLMKAYWFSDRWKEAWTLTAVIALFTAAASKTSVWMAEASGDLVNAIARFHDAETADPLAYLLSSAGFLILLVVVKDVGIIGLRHLCSTTLHRKWRSWLNSRFNDALLDANHTHFHLQNGGVGVDGMKVEPPDNVDQRIQESIKGMTGGAIGLAMGVMGVATSLFFVGQKLIEQSTAIEGLSFLGTYGAAVLAFAAVAAYVPLNTYFALRMGRVLERLTNAIQRAEGSYRAELTTLLRRSFHVSAARGEDVQKKMHARLYEDIDQTWAKLNWVHTAYQSFERVYNFLSARVVAYLPGLMPYVNDNISLKSYVTGAELVNSLINQCSWFIDVMPAIATLRANARRVTGLAVAIEEVQHPDAFYRRTGCRDLRYGAQNAVFGLTVRDLDLMHQGSEATPFLTIRNVRFRRGEWTYVKGASGSGKTSFIKAVNGLWPHGRGYVVFPEGVRTFYAAQDVKLPQLTLKELVCLPDAVDRHADADVASILARTGLGEFADQLGEESREGGVWDQVLSGGQKQKLVAARILLQQPGLLFLDEATGALDPVAKVAFHQAIKDNCPGIIVISVMHETSPPVSAAGVPFYDSVMDFSGGGATKTALAARPSAEIVETASTARPPEPRRLRLPGAFRRR
ncbi:ABC transporter ATP-binding protein/permease [Mesorhizobium sp. ZMM04-5]|uniref:ABC transporter ATP-binding protein/permease n=1 Tax=Mesorhizobium marinum TaxID=3228790 RepID=A0ABV3R2B0_9HYPH